LLVAVGVLAVAAVTAVALAARQTTRYEFLRFQDLAHGGPTSIPSEVAERVAAALTGRCCTSDVVREAATSLPPESGFIVVDPNTGSHVALGGAFLALRDVKVTAEGDRITIDARQDQGAIKEGIALRLQHAGLPIVLADGRAARVHVLPFRPAGEDAVLASLDRRLLIATSLVSIAVLVVTWGITRRIVGPVAELGDAARDLAGGDFSRRVDTRGSDEVADLARTFNAMAAQLERQQMLRQNLVHDVVHELRTPLTALRCRLETLLDGLATNPAETLRAVNEEVGHLSRMVDDLQELALAEARELRLSIEDVAVVQVVESAARAAGLEQDPRLRLEVDATLAARGDRVRVRQVLLNLLTNADRYTPPDGAITVSARGEGADAIINVRNTGETLDEDQLARVFDRFYRADPSRQRATGGAGLGLAIVKQLIEAQGGRLWARREADGMSFGFALPSAAARSDPSA
jgi:signal transduction histidine kinase